MKRCGVCGATYRTGSLVYALDANAQLRQVRACRGCARAAVPLVAGRPATKCACGAAATTCDACASSAADKARRPSRDMFATLAKKLRGLAAGYRAAPPTGRDIGEDEGLAEARQNGRADGLEQAADIVEARDW